MQRDLTQHTVFFDRRQAVLGSAHSAATALFSLRNKKEKEVDRCLRAFKCACSIVDQHSSIAQGQDGYSGR